MNQTKNSKKLTSRATLAQKMRLVELMKENVSIGGSVPLKLGNHSHRNHMTETFWEEAAETLNRAGETQKKPEQWRRCWIDWKAAVKRQYARIKSFENKPGLLSAPKPLGELDKQIVKFITTNPADGDKTASEPECSEDVTYKIKVESADVAINDSIEEPVLVIKTEFENSYYNDDEVSSSELKPGTSFATHADDVYKHKTEDPMNEISAVAKGRVRKKSKRRRRKNFYEEAKKLVVNSATTDQAILDELRKINSVLSEMKKDIDDIKNKMKV